MADWGFWVVAVAASLAAALVIARPLLRRGEVAAPRAAHDAQVFRDQLRQLDAEVARGVVAPEEAAGTRLELSRRLLAADDEARREAGAGAAPAIASRGLAALLVLAAPAGALWLYSDLGMPGAEDQPFASRGEAARPSQEEAEQMMAGRLPGPPPSEDVAEFERLVEQLEARLAEAPDDPQGLFLYARSLMNLGRFAEAWPVFGRLIALRAREADADLYAGYAEGMILAAGGYISPEAEAALLEVLKRAPTNPSARYYLGRLHAQDGNTALAAEVWAALLAESPPDAPWVAPIRAEMARLGVGRDGSDVAVGPDGLPGPTREDMEAAGALPEEDRQAMVADMVTRLAERLDAQGGTVAEWQRLIRSYSVLGRPREARAAMERAREAFAGDPAALAALESDPPAPARPRLALPRSALPGPDAGDVAAAEEMPAEDRSAMIEGMVARLRERLESEGGSPEEWLRLITSLAVLNRPDEARAVYEAARADHAEDPSALAVLEAAVEGRPRAAPAPAAPARGPSAEDMAAAADMAPEDRREMISGMVAQLHERLRAEGRAGDVNEWGRLMRSYRVLEDREAVRGVYVEAAALYADDSIAQAYLKEAALLNGVEFE
ncbi:MAG: c-type cytochrome biogenesis protein CcmI [Pikeienuella sp.]|uniref:c-type cytochrome biogenesis protein CcmI n=1 Tax=Pikeienuella sp. TaxID=2831957 RepID=UPI00391AB48F